MSGVQFFVDVTIVEALPGVDPAGWGVGGGGNSHIVENTQGACRTGVKVVLPQNMAIFKKNSIF